MSNIVMDYLKQKHEVENKDLSLIAKGMQNREVKNLILNQTSFLDEYKKVPFSERVYCVYNNVTERPICPYCNKRRISFVNGKYNKLCSSKKCLAKYTREKMQREYGVDNVFQLKEIKEKSKASNLEKYGVENAMQCKEVKNKQSESVFNSLGVKNPSQSEEIKQKKIDTSRANWGTDYPWQSGIGKKAQSDGVYKKHKVDNISKLDTTKQKKIETTRQHYGVDNPFQSELIKEKIKNFWMDNFNVINPSQIYEIQMKKLDGFKFIKHYTLPNGKDVEVVGHEGKFLDLLINELHIDYKLIDIYPREIRHYNNNDELRVWFPDVYVKPPYNWLIDFKSVAFTIHNFFNRMKVSVDQGFIPFYLFIYKEEFYKLSCTNLNTNGISLDSIFGEGKHKQHVLSYVKNNVNMVM